MDTVKQPDEAGYWWWRKNAEKEWALAEVELEPAFKARFFNGSRITDRPWGEWKKAVVQAP